MRKSPEQNQDDDLGLPFSEAPTGSLSYRSLGGAVPDEKGGSRTDLYLAENFKFLSRAGWQKRIRKGEVLVDGIAVDSSHRLRPGQNVQFYHPPSVEPDVNRDLYPIWRKGAVMAVFKPAPLPMHENGAYRKNTFAEILKEEVGPEWSAVHRLDRETSGIVLCGATYQVRRELAISLAERSLHKEYLAIAHGLPRDDNWIENGPIGDLTSSEIRIKKWVMADGLPSETHFHVKERRSEHALLKASPKTGRTNQIRIHAAFAGHHLVGDRLFYPDEAVFLDWFVNGLSEEIVQTTGHRRCLLHAHALSFRHPETGSIEDVSCPMPEDMQDFWETLA
jgi:23S rRNA pseudouridine1911/1915/1917 synthase